MDNGERKNLDIIAETGFKSRGGLRDYSEVETGNIQRVLGDFLCPTFKAKITFSFNSVTFNMACVNLFPDDQYVVIQIDKANLRLIVEPCVYYDRDSLKFANIKNGKNVPRKCTTKYFSAMLYEMMNWNPAAKYRSMAIFQDWGDKKTIVFNLDECLQLVPETIEVGDGIQKTTTRINMPENWRGRFGYTLAELGARNKLDTATTLITIDNKTGERYSRVVPKLPTPEELIHRPYGGIRERQEIEDEDE